MDKVERAGTGIQRMKDSMKAAGLPLPEIKYDTFFTITLRRPPKEEIPGSEKSSVKSSVKGSEKSSQKSSQKILEQISRQPEVTIEELATHIGIGSRAIKKHLHNLKEKGKLKRIGPDRGGRWEVIS